MAHCLLQGNLLEVDEEDHGVRFIHHSALSHMAGTAKSPHHSGDSWLSRAENLIGSVCVTYLSYSVFDMCMCVALRGQGLMQTKL